VKREILPLSIILLMFAIGMYSGPLVKVNALGQVPSQWGSAGQVVSWESKETALYLIPILAAIFYISFIIVPRIGICRDGAEQFASQFHGFKVIFVFVMGVIYVATLLPALGIWGSFDLIYVLVPAIALIFFYIGHMLNIRHDGSIVGISESTKAASEEVWRSTNRFGGRLFWFCGALILVSLIAPADARLWFLVVPLIFCAFAVFAYSVWEYRKAKRMQARGKGAGKGKKRRK
jgi:uncharacterized membrane protein